MHLYDKVFLSTGKCHTISNIPWHLKIVMTTINLSVGPYMQWICRCYHPLQCPHGIHIVFSLLMHQLQLFSSHVIYFSYVMVFGFVFYNGSFLNLCWSSHLMAGKGKKSSWRSYKPQKHSLHTWIVWTWINHMMLKLTYVFPPIHK